ncbi:hypothetical protein K0M31_005854 [Melipona bicolor]|uniref:Uncharacterized protein n=1 Tax=Melipona bicolor TaxID=60889 RepID=A0AA40FUY6_9HYME|nr:hypothetical protein K0M31_005854 [Melipona bicolor]
MPGASCSDEDQRSIGTRIGSETLERRSLSIDWEATTWKIRGIYEKRRIVGACTKRAYLSDHEMSTNFLDFPFSTLFFFFFFFFFLTKRFSFHCFFFLRSLSLSVSRSTCTRYTYTLISVSATDPTNGNNIESSREVSI